jgi:hypothetical protein
VPIPGRLDAIPAEEPETKDLRVKLDFAYSCFAFLGLALMAINSIQFADKGNQEGWGMLLGLWLVLPMVFALLAASVLTVIARRHAPLVVLCITTFLYLGIAIAAGLSDRTLDALTWTYGAIVTLAPVWWFTVGRWRNNNKPLLQP